MADISDVTAFLANAAKNAVYPSGILSPSVAGMDVRIFEGWPVADQLELDMAGKMLSGTPPVPIARPGGPLINVSVFPMLGNTATPYQILDSTWLISPPVYGLAISVVNGVITITGTPTAGEYLSIIADRTYAHSESGVSAAAIIASLAADFAANYSGVSSTASTLTIPYKFDLTVRQGAVGTLGKVIHRQKQSVMITTWAPTHAARTTIAKAIDVTLKIFGVITMPDTSQANLSYNRTNVMDDQQMRTVYRRDLIYDVEYATLETFPGYVITSVDTSVANYNNSAIVHGLT